MMLGIATPWAAAQLTSDPFAALTALARGTPEREAWEMTKWFDTNYHYVVPEISGPVSGVPAAALARADGRRRRDLGGPRPVHADAPEPAGRWAGPGDRGGLGRGRAVGVGRAAHAADPAFRLQLDEPSLGMALSETDEAIRDAAYAGAPEFAQRPRS